MLSKSLAEIMGVASGDSLTLEVMEKARPVRRVADGYRVLRESSPVQKKEVLKIPISALFRQGESWCVFVVEHGRAERRTVSVGHLNQSEVEIVSGL